MRALLLHHKDQRLLLWTWINLKDETFNIDIKSLTQQAYINAGSIIATTHAAAFLGFARFCKNSKATIFVIVF